MRLTTLALFALAAVPLSAQTGLELFENGSNGAGWGFQASTPDIHETSGGFGGGWIHNPQVLTGAPRFTSTISPSCFEGDFRERNVTGVQVSPITISNQGGTAGFLFSLVLRDTKGTPSLLDDDYAYFVGPQIPQAGAGWTNVFFNIPSRSTSPTPTGWSGGWSGDCCAFRPGVEWGDVISSVDRMEFWWDDPSTVSVGQAWDVGLDNIRILNQSSTAIRNGAGLNSASLAATSLPVIGQDFDLQVNQGLVQPGVFPSYLVISRHLTSGFQFSSTIQGELLVLPPFVIQEFSPTGDYSLPVPADCSITGRFFSAQAASINPTNFLLSNALDFTVGSI